MLYLEQLSYGLFSQEVTLEVCILHTHDIFEANLVQAKLENHGIPCDLRTNDAGGMIPHLRLMHGIQIYISQKDMKKAQEILSAD